MIFSNLILQIVHYFNINNPRSIEIIKSDINECVKDFCRMKEWMKCQKVTPIILNGSPFYSTDTEAENICSVIHLLNEAYEPMTKFDFILYKSMLDKINSYSLLGNNLYIDGSTGTRYLLYTSFGGKGTGTPSAGDLFPLTYDNDEIPITKHYWEIIKQMVIVKRLTAWGDAAMLPAEQQELNKNLIILIANENRQHNSGQINVFRR